jgi:hypothetical protein
MSQQSDVDPARILLNRQVECLGQGHNVINIDSACKVSPAAGLSSCRLYLGSIALAFAGSDSACFRVIHLDGSVCQIIINPLSYLCNALRLNAYSIKILS